MRNRVRMELRSAIDEALALGHKSSSSSSPGGLIATYYADNGANNVSLGSSQTTIAQVTGVVTVAGDKLFISHSVQIENQSDSGSAAPDIQVKLDATVVDECFDAPVAAEASVDIARSFMVVSPAPGTHTVTLTGATSIGSAVAVGSGEIPSGTPGSRITVMVVSV